MPSLLLTGATGFIGRHCVEPLLQRGWEIQAVTSRPVEDLAARPGLTWHRADLLEPGAPGRLIAKVRPDALLHLAWRLIAGSVENYRWVRASLELAMEFAEQGGRRAVLAGSCAEYDWLADQPLGEDSPRRPATPYGLCKMALGDLFDSYRQEVALSAAWARVFFVYGPGEAENRLVPSVTRALLAGEPALTTHGRQRRDYLYVEDLADALAALVDSDLTGPINLASGQATELESLVRELARQLGREDLLRLGAVAAHPEEAPEVRADIGRLSGELGWQPSIDPSEGLGRTIAWWQDRLAGIPA